MERMNLSIAEFVVLFTSYGKPLFSNLPGVSPILWFGITIDGFATVSYDSQYKPVYTVNEDLNKRYRVDISLHTDCIFINKLITI